MDSAHEHPFSFNEAISLIVNCETLEEIDHIGKNSLPCPKRSSAGGSKINMVFRGRWYPRTWMK